ncbi:hypothetical protein M899_2275 [Bacteriovorax sp. BSW11_IV]|uniref:hypothetical protein n=1 Tax=Bacteriovorax sp. BSW11_IV TaxID=1353529 RepID=UPI00038A251E|nr:hypothetical protein [Bacteriovorax sp. BSW11_IV]EQC48804.1 hypothetical protein M899_2275 [Bacteriovorax sp. BSW11_IV]
MKKKNLNKSVLNYKRLIKDSDNIIGPLVLLFLLAQAWFYNLVLCLNFSVIATTTTFSPLARMGSVLLQVLLSNFILVFLLKKMFSIFKTEDNRSLRALSMGGLSAKWPLIFIVLIGHGLTKINNNYMNIYGVTAFLLFILFMVIVARNYLNLFYKERTRTIKESTTLLSLLISIDLILNYSLSEIYNYIK